MLAKQMAGGSTTNTNLWGLRVLPDLANKTTDQYTRTLLVIYDHFLRKSAGDLGLKDGGASEG